MEEVVERRAGRKCRLYLELRRRYGRREWNNRHLICHGRPRFFLNPIQISCEITPLPLPRRNSRFAVPSHLVTFTSLA
ncbi:hypothetical protein ACLOJK_005383 [Asimina triloba]